MRHARWLPTLLLVPLMTWLTTRPLAAVPPTVDPTYGLPIPASRADMHVANWIWTAMTSGTQTIYLRRVFALSTVPKTATLFITADDAFTLFINGRQLDQSTPVENGWRQVHRLNAAPWLVPGRNVLAVRGANADGPAGVLAKLEMVDLPDIGTDGSWKVFEGAAPPGWAMPTFQDAAWLPATVEAPVGAGVWGDNGSLEGWPGYQSLTAPYLAHMTLPVAAVLDVQPGAGAFAGAGGLPGRADAVLAVTPPPAGASGVPSLVLDFGEEVAGRVKIVSLTPGAVQVGTGESLQEATQSPWGGLHPLSLAPGWRRSPHTAPSAMPA